MPILHTQLKGHILAGWVLLAILLFVVAFWSVINLLPRYRRSLDRQVWFDADLPIPADPPTVAIVCPGRNEAEHIRTTLPELCRQDLPGYRVIYVDDESSDATPDITAAVAKQYSHLSVVRLTAPPPAGWVGKCWAMHQGYHRLVEMEDSGRPGLAPAVPPAIEPRQAPTYEAEGPAQWLCLTDADIHWHPAVLRHSLAHAETANADVVSLFPMLLFGSPVETVVQAQMVLAMGIIFPFDKAMDPKHPDTLTGGAFMLIRRSLYDAVGGHEAVRDRIVDDVCLGRALKAAGGKISIALAPDLLSCRMYENWPDMWEGLTKNAFAGIEYHHGMLAVALVSILFANVLSPVYLALALAWTILAPSIPAWIALALAVLAIVLPAAALNRVRKLLHLRWWVTWSMPAGSGLYWLILLASAWRYHRGGNRWKGRAYGPGAA